MSPAQVEGVLEHEHMISRQLVANGNSDRALVILRKKRLQQARLKDLDNWLLKVEQMVSAEPLLMTFMRNNWQPVQLAASNLSSFLTQVVTINVCIC